MQKGALLAEVFSNDKRRAEAAAEEISEVYGSNICGIAENADLSEEKESMGALKENKSSIIKAVIGL